MLLIERAIIHTSSFAGSHCKYSTSRPVYAVNYKDYAQLFANIAYFSPHLLTQIIMTKDRY